MASFLETKNAQYWQMEAERAWLQRNQAVKERDAAIAAKEAAEKSERIAAEGLAAHMAYSAKTRNVVEAARAALNNINVEKFLSAQQILRDALRALDAGEALKPTEDQEAWARAHSELDSLRSALARAEEEREESIQLGARTETRLIVAEKEEKELRGQLAAAEIAAEKWYREAKKWYREAFNRATQLATIVERTAKAQRSSDANFAEQWLDGEVHLPSKVKFVSEAIPYAPLVTLSTLPEADSSGGGETADPNKCTRWVATTGCPEHGNRCRLRQTDAFGLYGQWRWGSGLSSTIAAEIASWPEEADDTWCGSDYCDQQCFPGLRRCWGHRHELDPAPPKSEAKPKPEAIDECTHFAPLTRVDGSKWGTVSCRICTATNARIAELEALLRTRN